jgi:formamidopyrimidine-DNA glycosylase
MPELPDLQAFSLNLQKKLGGKTIKEIVVNTNKLNVTVAELNSLLVGHKLKHVFRVGKELHFEFQDANILALHLMLHGEMVLVSADEAVKHSVVELVFTDGRKLVLSDFQKQATPTLNPLPSATPDALSNDAGFDYLKTVLGSKKAIIKNILLDQHVIRGIGNAYADEILWAAKISPFSVANKIPENAIKELSHSIISVLQDAEKQIVKKQPDIISGEIRDFLKIHQTKLTESPTGGKILIKKMGARKTYYTDEQILYA